MRIIAGQFRGRRLLGPADATTTRPITDRVKESLFNRLQSLGVLGEGRVLDLFCGTGSMGIEALSRGATHCTFVDQDRQAIETLKKNLEQLQLEKTAYQARQASVFSPVWQAGLAPESIALAFIDPPYPVAEADPQQVLTLVENLGPSFEDGGVGVVRTPKGLNLGEVDNLDGPASFTYGSMTLNFYQKPIRTE
jgi:16S rRNA (guanine966-N2)-methyltransferase